MVVAIFIFAFIFAYANSQEISCCKKVDANFEGENCKNISQKFKLCSEEKGLKSQLFCPRGSQISLHCFFKPFLPKCCNISQIFSESVQKCVSGTFEVAKVEWSLPNDEDFQVFFQKDEIEIRSQLLSPSDCHEQGMK